MVNDVKDTPVYNDIQGLQNLKHQAKVDQEGSLDKVARQFESIFIQMALKMYARCE